MLGMFPEDSLFRLRHTKAYCLFVSVQMWIYANLFKEVIFGYIMTIARYHQLTASENAVQLKV